VAFGSDDVPVDEDVRKKVLEVNGIEDALLLKLGSRTSPLREGWGPWFDAKSDFFRKDRMFKSDLEALNPQNNPLLQDPDGVGVTGLTRGDKVVQKGLLNEQKGLPFLGKKPLAVHESKSEDTIASDLVQGRSTLSQNSISTTSNFAKETLLRKDSSRGKEIKRVERKTLGEGAGAFSHERKLGKDSHVSDRDGTLIQSIESSPGRRPQQLPVPGAASNSRKVPKLSRPIYAD
ncbi:hypothetical protein Droror1_Dr00018048, partial [Drosera rotundifolia]